MARAEALRSMVRDFGQPIMKARKELASMRLSLLLALAAIFALPRAAQAQDSPDGAPRTLRGHLFATPASIDSAFVQTFFGTRTTARYQTVNNLPVGAYSINVSMLGVSENVSYGQALGDRVTIGVSMIGLTVVGLNGSSIATAGALYAYGATLDAAVRLLRLEDTGTQIALRGEMFGVQGGGRISLVPFIRAVRSDPMQDVPNALLNFGELLNTPLSRIGGAASINFAQAISSVFSVQASFRLDVRRNTNSPFVLGQGRVEVSSTAWTPQGGIALAAIPPGWPVTFSAEYRISGQDSHDPTSPARHLAVFAPYYSGRADLQLGPVVTAEFGLPTLEGVGSNGDVRRSERGKAFAGQLMMRYFW
jgi:hypothetical protein